MRVLEPGSRGSRCRTQGLWRALAVATLLVLPAAGAHDGYTLAIVPRLPVTVTDAQWGPFAERLGREIGTPVHLLLYRSKLEFEQDVGKGRSDLVFMDGYMQLHAYRQPGYIPLVRDSSAPLSGLLVVRQDSPVRVPADLAGQRIAFPHPNAFGASLYMRALLHEQFNLRFTPVYVGTHANTYRQVIAGEVAAGGGVNTTLEREPPDVRGQLRIIYRTPDTASHPLSAHKRLSAAQRQIIVKAILRMAGDPSGQEALDAIGLTQPAAADYVRDYQPLERLHLDRYLVNTDDAAP